ncbi:phosphoethanolamine N-methyltransferase 3-like [Haliotis rufescens]|uniref:phosphoethanolamine N-methyltransferase 3-like n=1 Tax=Haliotis rufescens TaxID=6454 RepID=UPI00201F0EA8|nr:phosphoethanolamine N-methyltransferase 3-like [Haliotis rufescens]
MDNNDCVRKSMTDFWKQCSTPCASVVEMMLDIGAEELAELEQPEILSYLPDFAGKRVMDLGAGIGRFTSTFAMSACSVLAIDFMHEFLEKNKTINSHYKNIEFQCGDVTKLQRDNRCANLVFSNWLLMYLSDKEVLELLQKVLEWLDDDGYLFIRESCLVPSGLCAVQRCSQEHSNYTLKSCNYRRMFNPTNYRNAMTYEALFASSDISCDIGQSYGFQCVMSTSLGAYTKLKDNRNQIVWLLQKVKRNKSRNTTFTESLELQETYENHVIRCQKVFACTSLGVEALGTTEVSVDMLDLNPHHTVLDVGCGLGSRSLDMVKKYGCKVVGVDMSIINRRHAEENAKENAMGPDQVKFEFADLTKRNYSTESFDAIYSRDSICAIADKLTLFGNVYKWLKPGGKVLISDYCCSAEDHSEVFKEYVKLRGYTLYSPAQYAKSLEKAGFEDVRVEDKTQTFTETLTTALNQTYKRSDEFIGDFSQKDFDDIVSGWKDTLHQCEEGEQRWGIFHATKPRTPLT